MTGYKFKTDWRDVGGDPNNPINMKAYLIAEIVELPDFTSLIESKRLQEGGDVQFTVSNTADNAGLVQNLSAIQIMDQLYIIDDVEYTENEITGNGKEFSFWFFNRKTLYDYRYTEHDKSGNDLIKRIIADLIEGSEDIPYGLDPDPPTKPQQIFDDTWQNSLVINNGRLDTVCLPGIDIPILEKGDNISDWLYDTVEKEGWGIFTKSLIVPFSGFLNKIILWIKVAPLNGINPFTQREIPKELISAFGSGVISYRLKKAQRLTDPEYAMTIGEPYYTTASSELSPDSKIGIITQNMSTYKSRAFLTHPAPWQQTHTPSLELDSRVLYDSQIDPLLFDFLYTADGKVDTVFPSDYAVFLASKWGFGNNITMKLTYDITGQIIIMRVGNGMEPGPEALGGFTKVALNTNEGFRLVKFNSHENASASMTSYWSELKTRNTRKIDGKYRHEYTVYPAMDFAYVYKDELFKYAEAIKSNPSRKQSLDKPHVVLSRGAQAVMCEAYLFQQYKKDKDLIDFQLEPSRYEAMDLGQHIIFNIGEAHDEAVCITKIHTLEEGQDSYDAETIELGGKD